MKVIKFLDFLRESNLQDPPEEYIKTSLLKLKKKIESFFQKSEEEDQDESDELMTMSKALKKGEELGKKSGEILFKDLNVRLESSEMSKYSAIYDSLTFKFSDEENFYSLYITIPLEEGMSKKKDVDFSDDDIINCSVKFKKYDLNFFELIGQIGPKKVKIKDINEEFLVDLKIELDEKFGDSEEELVIET